MTDFTHFRHFSGFSELSAPRVVKTSLVPNSGKPLKMGKFIVFTGQNVVPRGGAKVAKSGHCSKPLFKPRGSRQNDKQWGQKKSWKNGRFGKTVKIMEFSTFSHFSVPRQNDQNWPWKRLDFTKMVKTDTNKRWFSSKNTVYSVKSGQISSWVSAKTAKMSQNMVNLWKLSVLSARIVALSRGLWPKPPLSPKLTKNHRWVLNWLKHRWVLNWLKPPKCVKNHYMRRGKCQKVQFWQKVVFYHRTVVFYHRTVVYSPQGSGYSSGQWLFLSGQWFLPNRAVVC